MYTSYFGKYIGDFGISIARKMPRGFWIDEYKDLFPSSSILYQWFKNKDIEIYTQRYNEEILNKLNPETVYSDLKDKVLLCWERSDKFCHRFLVAEWIEKNLGINVPEI